MFDTNNNSNQAGKISDSMSNRAATEGIPKTIGFPPSIGFPDANPFICDESSKDGVIPKTVKSFEGIKKLNKSETASAWKEFGGDRLAVFSPDGNDYITRIVERNSKKNGMFFKLTEKLTRNSDGYGYISWHLDYGTMSRRKSTGKKFDESWHDAILAKVREVVVDGTPVTSATKALAAELGAPYGTMRANLWVANKWAQGESSNFLPNRLMIRPIFELLCELGKKDLALASLSAYCTEVSNPSEYVLAVLREYRE